MLERDTTASSGSEDFNEYVLLASDYDGTQFRTFESPPGGIGVNEAYEMSISRLLGPAALNRYRQQGGHNNRTPAEIVESLIGVSRGHLLEDAVELKREGASNTETLEFIDQHPKRTLIHGWLFATEEQLRVISGLLVEAKLELLLGQIGQKIDDGIYWPCPVEGFVEFANAVAEGRSGNTKVNTAVVSAGHGAFIQKTYDLYGIPSPDVLITDETIQGHNSKITSDRRAKPAPYPMALAKREWLKMHSVSPLVLRDPVTAGTINERIVYIGDDPIKDSGFAEKCHVGFVLLDPANPELAWSKLSDWLISRVGRVSLEGASNEG